MIVLAWMPLAASVMPSAILSLTLMFLAWQRLTWFVAFVAVAVIWRGEAWKAVFLESAQQLSELRRQLPQPNAPRTGFSRLESASI